MDESKVRIELAGDRVLVGIPTSLMTPEDAKSAGRRLLSVAAKAAYMDMRFEQQRRLRHEDNGREGGDHGQGVG